MTKVATKTTATKAAPKGPKQGSARANQTAGYAKGELTKAPKAKVNPDTITSVKGTSDGTGYTAISAGNKTEMVKDVRMTGQLRKLAVVGASFKAVQEYLKANKPEAKLAKGLDGKNAPQSAMAAAASRAGAKATDVPATKATAPKTTGKASATSKLSRKGGAVRTYKATKKEDVSRDGTFRKYMISTIRAHTDTDSAKAAHAKSGQYAKDKLNFNWAEQNGFIAWA